MNDPTREALVEEICRNIHKERRAFLHVNWAPSMPFPFSPEKPSNGATKADPDQVASKLRGKRNAPRPLAAPRNRTLTRPASRSRNSLKLKSRLELVPFQKRVYFSRMIAEGKPLRSLLDDGLYCPVCNRKSCRFRFKKDKNQSKPLDPKFS